MIVAMDVFLGDPGGWCTVGQAASVQTGVESLDHFVSAA